MKTIVCIVMLLCLTALAVKAQEFDTMLVRKDDAVLTVLKPKTEKIISTLEFSGVNPDIFSDEEIRQLEKGKEVIKESSKINLPVSLLPIVKEKQFWTTKIYGKDKGSVKQTKSDIVFGSEKKNSLLLSLFCLYLPVLCIFVFSWLSTGINKGRKKMFAFTISTFFAVFLAIIVGRFAGESMGGVIGGFAGGLAGAFAGVLAGGFAGVLAGGFAGGLAGGFAGMFAGGFAESGFTLNSPEFQIIWHFLGFYLVACLLAIGLRELMVLPRKGNDEKTVVV